MEEGSLKEHIREYWTFLMSSYDKTTIGKNTEVRRAKSSGGFDTVNFKFPGGKIILYKKGDSFATFVWELPFPATVLEEATATSNSDGDEYSNYYDGAED